MSGCLQRIDPRTCVPDHALLTWIINIPFIDGPDYSIVRDSVCGEYNRYDVKSIPLDFLQSADCQFRLNETILRLENSCKTQNDVNTMYSSFVNIVKLEMNEKLNSRRIRLSDSVSSNKKRRINKPWWTDELSQLWNNMCAAEKEWRSNTDRRKTELKTIYLSYRKHFDQTVQRTKRQYWFKIQFDIDNMEKHNTQDFWKTIGKIGVGNERRKIIPFEVEENGRITRDRETVLTKWKDSFQSLLNPINVDISEYTHTDADPRTDCDFNSDITYEEVKRAITRAKLGKSVGIDEIPVEVLKNDCTIDILHRLFSVCFSMGIIPDDWNYSIISPIPKSSTGDIRNPLNYRGISLAPACYKLYCGVLNVRLETWVTENNILHDEQNGFRKSRSTIDHLSSVTSIIETRKAMKKDTFVSFIDFSKAYDSIPRNILWSKLKDNGLGGRLYNALISLYKTVKSCVRLNGLSTDFFNVKCGLKQGCLLSPLLFNLYINDLVSDMKQLNSGIDIDGEKVCILLYADDVILMADTEEELNGLLDCLHQWCEKNCLKINKEKSKILHFRRPSSPRSNFVFTCGDQILDYSSQYKYLGLILQEHLDFSITAKAVAQSASRALGLVIAKTKTYGGFPFGTYSKLYDSTVNFVISYGASIWGTREYSCVSAVQHRACRFYLGVGKFTPNAAVEGDMGWLPQEVRQWNDVLRLWGRLKDMDAGRLNRKVYCWAETNRTRTKNWNDRLNKHLESINCAHFLDGSNHNLKHVISTCEKLYFDVYKDKWENELNRERARRGNGHNKLRTYRTFKQNFETEPYVKFIMPLSWRSSLAKFRAGVAPLRLETGRYENLPVNQRTCFNCRECVESENHVLLHCPLYEDLQHEMFHEALQFYPQFNVLNDDEKIVILFSDVNLVKTVAKTCKSILDRRRRFLYK